MRIRVDVQAEQRALLLQRQLIGIVSAQKPSFAMRRRWHSDEVALALLILGAERIGEFFVVGLRALVQHARIDRGGHQVVARP